VSVEQLSEGDLLVASASADEASLANGRVPNDDALDQLLIRQFVIHQNDNVNVVCFLLLLLLLTILFFFFGLFVC
jgi:hypothetical protein